MTAYVVFLPAVVWEHDHSTKQCRTVDPEGQAHPNQLLKVNLEQVKVCFILAYDKYNKNPEISTL